MTCQHPKDSEPSVALLVLCPDCGARCSETKIGDDDLCYDGHCPLHVLAGAIPLPRSRPYETPEERAGRERAEEDKFDYLKDEGLLRRP